MPDRRERRGPGPFMGRLLTLTVLVSSVGAAAADPKVADPATDAELLEFLGSVDSGADSQAADDGSWIDYLATTDIAKVAKTGGPSDAPRPKAAGSQPPATDAATSGDKKND